VSEEQKPVPLWKKILAGIYPALMLRTRLFLNLAPFVILLLGIGVYAIVLFSHITTDIDVTVTENYRSARAAQQMELALRRMEEGVLLAMDDNNKGLGSAVFEENRKTFEEALERQFSAMKAGGQTNLNQQLTTNYAAFKNSGLKILAATDQASSTSPHFQATSYQRPVIQPSSARTLPREEVMMVIQSRCMIPIPI